MTPDHPVELARRLVRAGEEDAEHVQPDRDHHAVRRPAVHVAHQHPERHVELEILHVGVGVLGGRPVVEHQIDAGDHRHQEHQEGDAAHAPGEAQARGVLAHLGGVQVQPDVARHHEDAVARRVLVAVPEDRLPDLRLHDLALDLIEHRHTAVPNSFVVLMSVVRVLRPSGTRPGLSHVPKMYLTLTSTTICPSSAW